MKNPTIQSLLVFLLLTSFLTAQNTTELQLYFDSDRHQLTAEHLIKLKNLETEIPQNAYAEYTIVGYTDQDGSDEYNYILSQKRAESVKNSLINEGTKPSLITLDWKGEKELVNDQKKMNRRVTVRVNTYTFENSKALLSSVNNPSLQNHLIDNTTLQTITCQKGTTVTIPDNAFMNEDGTPVSSKINIEIKEAYSYADFIADELYTQSKGELLETGGMLYINATADGKDLKLKDGKTIDIKYPAQNTKKDMELFYASTNDANQIDWSATSQRIPVAPLRRSNYDYDIDWDLLLDFDFGEVIEKPTLSFSQMPSKPSLGHKPFPPSKPIQPTLDNTPINIKGIDKVFMSKQKKEKLQQEKLDKAIVIYNEKVKKYEEDYKNYLTNLKNYNEAKPSRIAALEKWNKEVDHRIGAVTSYKRNMKKYHVYAQIKGVSKKIKSEIGKRTNKELLAMIDGLINAPITLSMSERKMYRKVFDNQTKRILDERKIFPEHVDYVTEHNASVFPEIRNIISLVKKQKAEEEYAKTGRIDNDNFGSYITGISQLGWINIDRFIKLDPRTLASINLEDDNEDTKYYLIFKDIRSMLKARRVNGNHKFTSIPQNKNVKIVGVKLIDNIPQIAVTDYKVKEQNNLNLEFREATLKEIRAELNALDALANN